MGKKHRIFVTLSVATSGLVLLSSPATATFTGPDSADQEIIVTGNKTTKAAIADLIRTTIAKPKGGRHDGQYARFTRAICPKVVGLSETNKQQVEKRMRGVAQAAGIKVVREGCTPNIFVMVVSDGEEAISMLRKKKSRLFGGMSHYERQQVANSGGPVYSWKRIQTGSAESGALQNSDEVSIVPSDQGETTQVPIMYSNVKSNIKWTTQKSMTHSFLLIEKDALVGLTTIQIADYAAMSSFINTKKRHPSSIPSYSILSLFNSAKPDRKVPASISEMDLVLLSSLYSSPADVSASMQSAAMLHSIEKELTSRDDQ